MLTLDHDETAAAVAVELGISKCRSELMTEDKLASVHTLQDEGHMVTMVCGGINGASTLITADIGIARGLVGTDIVVVTSNVALASDDLSRALDVHDLGRHAAGVVRENYKMSRGVNVIGLLVNVGGTLSPALTGILHSASSVAVVGNNSRLIRYQLTTPRGQQQ